MKTTLIFRFATMLVFAASSTSIAQTTEYINPNATGDMMDPASWSNGPPTGSDIALFANSITHTGINNGFLEADIWQFTAGTWTFTGNASGSFGTRQLLLENDAELTVSKPFTGSHNFVVSDPACKLTFTNPNTSSFVDGFVYGSFTISNQHRFLFDDVQFNDTATFLANNAGTLMSGDDYLFNHKSVGTVKNQAEMRANDIWVGFTGTSNDLATLIVESDGSVDTDDMVVGASIMSGKLIINGGIVSANDFQVRATGEIEFSFDPDAAYAPIVANVSAQLDGKLTLIVSRDLSPGEEFLILDGTNSGTFDTVVVNGAPSAAVEYRADGIYLARDPEPTTIVPTSVIAVLGDHESGELSDVDESDDSYLKYLSGHPFSPTSPSIWLEFEGTLSSDSPTAIQIVLESQVNDIQITQKIEAFNFNTGQFELVDTRTATRNADSVATIDLPGDVTRFVEPGTGLVKTKVTYTQGLGGFFLSWRACIDQMIWIAQ